MSVSVLFLSNIQKFFTRNLRKEDLVWLIIPKDEAYHGKKVTACDTGCGSSSKYMYIQGAERDKKVEARLEKSRPAHSHPLCPVRVFLKDSTPSLCHQLKAKCSNT